MSPQPLEAARPTAVGAMGRPPPAASLDGAMAFWLAIGVTLLVYFAPLGDLVGRPLMWLATMVHELGHGITAMLTGGDLRELTLWADGSGSASSTRSGEMAGAVIAAGGLVGPSVAAAFGFALAQRGRTARIALATLGAFLLWVLLFKVRTLFGLTFVASVVALCGGVAVFASARAAQLVLMFLSVQLALSLWSDLGYMFSDTAATGGGTSASDSAAIASALGGPYWLWGAICGLASLAALAFGCWLVLRRGARRNPTSAYSSSPSS